MTRAYFRLSLCAVCALAALTGPIVFLEDQARIGYLLSGFGAALTSWALLSIIMAVEPNLNPVLQGIVGVGAAVFSWMPISMVTVFAVIPHLYQAGFARFDPVWIMGGLSPLMIPVVAWWQVRHGGAWWQSLVSAMLRFSGPLFGLTLAARALGLAKQYVWLSLFTGVMFLVLDALGAGSDLPLHGCSNGEIGARA